MLFCFVRNGSFEVTFGVYRAVTLVWHWKNLYRYCVLFEKSDVSNYRTMGRSDDSNDGGMMTYEEAVVPIASHSS